MKKSLKVGDKVKGFKFEKSSILTYNYVMDEYVNVTGIISEVDIRLNRFTITFPDGIYWTYPLNHSNAKPLLSFKNKLK